MPDRKVFCPKSCPKYFVQSLKASFPWGTFGHIKSVCTRLRVSDLKANGPSVSFKPCQRQYHIFGSDSRIELVGLAIFQKNLAEFRLVCLNILIDIPSFVLLHFIQKHPSKVSLGYNKVTSHAPQFSKGRHLTIQSIQSIRTKKAVINCTKTFHLKW